jgi:1,4-dihydroxy-2-naphthoyl-CoA synthase
MTTTQIEAVSLVLNHKNWTSLTLRELVDAGRIQADDQRVIRDFTKAALGEPLNMDEWHEQREIPKLVILALQGFAIGKGDA